MKTLLSGLAAAALLSTSAFADPAIWRASDADSEIYLFGSIHILQPTTQWRSDLLEQILAEADEYYYELPMTAEAQAASQALIPQYGLMPQGSSMLDLLTPEQIEQLERIGSQYGLTAPALAPFQPWLAAVTLSVLSMQAQGYAADAGVDATLARETEDDRERELESFEQQFGFFANLPMETQAEFLTVTLDQIENEADLLGGMVTAWAAGDTAALEALFHDSMRGTDAALYDVLITQRNIAWTDEIQALMSGDGKTVMIVGAGHLVGPDGVPTMLEARGITVERVQ